MTPDRTKAFEGIVNHIQAHPSQFHMTIRHEMKFAQKLIDFDEYRLCLTELLSTHSIIYVTLIHKKDHTKTDIAHYRTDASGNEFLYDAKHEPLIDDFIIFFKLAAG